MLIRKEKNNFNAGMLSSYLYHRYDLNIYKNGAKKIINGVILPSGGVKKRSGTKLIDYFETEFRCEGYEIKGEGDFVICFADKFIKIFNVKNNKSQTIESIYSFEEIKNACFAQNNNCIYIATGLKKIHYLECENGMWELKEFDFLDNGSTRFSPFMKSEEPVKFSIDSNNYIVANKPFFNKKMIGSCIKIMGGTVELCEFVSEIKMKFNAKTPVVGGNNITRWEMEIFNEFYGFPKIILFHNGRMILANNERFPNYIFMSKTGEINNFMLGDALDTDGIMIGISKNSSEQILSIFVDDDIKVHTDKSLWVIPSTYVTPMTIEISKNNNFGIREGGYKKILNVNNNVFYTSYHLSGINSLVGNYDERYSVNNMATTCMEYIKNIFDMVWDEENSHLLCVMENGEIGCLIFDEKNQISGWSIFKTTGKYKAITEINDNTYVCVKRSGFYTLEKFDQNLKIDCSSPDFNNKVFLDKNIEYSFVGENSFYIKNLPENLNKENYYKGFGYPFEIETLNFLTPQDNVKSFKIISIEIAMHNTADIEIEYDKSLKKIKGYNSNIDVFGKMPKMFSGNIKNIFSGWKKDIEKSSIMIRSNVPVDTTILGIILDIKKN